MLNPGSISLPKENNPNSYAVLEGGEFIVKDFEGNVVKRLPYSERDRLKELLKIERLNKGDNAERQHYQSG